ncbi:hypothetical protein AKJ65_04710 [candidate division MSBL1 archaeon SCGC-AAA259E19]|uniref:Uncharacterized protein n=1 Tax=candidate division MSBL1 archaeon SCGC-AAA259E19 TaxID=1698264 RepID=A0A133UJE1_9EURY|nr:hypothetical protein AKJ65_04710 [candidate division MSBL1 archaeon SCGC-AAA259E19]
MVREVKEISILKKPSERSKSEKRQLDTIALAQDKKVPQRVREIKNSFIATDGKCPTRRPRRRP